MYFVDRQHSEEIVLQLQTHYGLAVGEKKPWRSKKEF